MPLSEGVAKAIVAAGLGCFTAGVAVAVLGYGLYEIDVILNRTLVYGLLTVLLGLGYAALRAGWWAAGRSGRSSLAVAAATLAVAALFGPPGGASRRRWTGASTAASTTRRKQSRRSAPASGTVDLDALSAEVCWPWPTTPCSQRR